MDWPMHLGRTWAYALAVARVIPTVSLVPALSVRGLPAQSRLVFGLVLGAALVPQVAGLVGPSTDVPLDGAVAVGLWFRALLAGVPWALVTAAPLWVATHLGALADQLRGSVDLASPMEGTDGGTPLARLSGLLAASVWLQQGGVVRALWLLDGSAASGTRGELVALSELLRAIHISLLLSTMVAVPVLVFEVLAAAITRAAAPWSPRPLVVLVRPLLVLLVYGAALETAVLHLGLVRPAP